MPKLHEGDISYPKTVELLCMDWLDQNTDNTISIGFQNETTTLCLPPQRKKTSWDVPDEHLRMFRDPPHLQDPCVEEHRVLPMPNAFEPDILAQMLGISLPLPTCLCSHLTIAQSPAFAHVVCTTNILSEEMQGNARLTPSSAQTHTTALLLRCETSESNLETCGENGFTLC